ncbi:hypothetical protein QBC46DRAFT_372312 [Diplogelasinospora grovesii]|uniref:RNA recognition motif-containing protein n=1 Tax=Diplogelasinospora grovesii TaxID=303347 RepID=A0AAN6S9Z1_9PEZI|nr:hypothetical protein QBC46DRAFT_372312 [Diplogelasinospora grovesii]
MAARPGEEDVATLFGDIHYFYGPPTDNPPHHRFDKGSYVYLFEDPNQGRARVEIANQPGTEDQDAFDGYLDTAHLHYSYKHTCLVTLTVGEVQGHEEWHLPTYDPHNQNKYHYKLHSLDIYFYTPQDALLFVNGIRRVINPAQCEILDEPGPPPMQQHSNDVSSVVQRLEKAAIADSGPSTHSPASGISQNPPNGSGVPSFAGPPTSAVGGEQQPPPQAFAPIPYNPAAPPAPEQIRHREKTPPPEDGIANPLHQTLAYDAATPFSPGLAPSGLGPLSPGIPPPQFHRLPGAPSFPGPPQPSALASPGMPPPGYHTLGGHPTGLAQHPSPAHPGLARAATMPVVPGLGSPYGANFPANVAAGIGAMPQHTSTPPLGVGTPGLPSAPSAPPSMQQDAGYGYNNASASEYAVHHQCYVPEDKYKPKQETKGKLEENAGRLERGVTGMLKKFEKKFG